MTAGDTRTTLSSASISKTAGRGKACRHDTSSSGEIRRQALVVFIAFLVCVAVAAAVIVSEIAAHEHIRWDSPANF